MRRILNVFGALLVGFVLGFALLVGVCVALNSRTPAPTDLSHSEQLSHPPAPLREPVTLKIVTFNIWDLYALSTRRAERMALIGETLVGLNPDIVGFQEAWVEADRAIILKRLEEIGLVNSQYFRSGLVGSGLLVASRYPIAEAFFHRYTQGGIPYRVDHGDWWAGKGVCVARIALPNDVGYLDFFDTHTHAQYGLTLYDSIRLSQAQELAAFINKAATGTSPAIAVGDFNTKADQEQYKTLVETAKLKRVMKMESRIDHVFAVESPRYRFEVVDTVQIGVDDRKERIRSGMSDHPGYMTTVRIVPAGTL
ncbi:MAG: endonuclease/exonuclease/phosphatase family protein [Candidatus Hydrogenedentes bacterium]|nr:endonuclease/exonuclease/phosphatase family protein [Candidatus Hydrogenedentota bacterium]